MPEHMKLVENSKPMANLKSTTSTLSYSSAARDRNEGVTKLAAQFYEVGKILAVICHATCILLKTRLSNGNLLVEGKTWTGFANSEEQYADSYVGRHIQPFRVEDEARKLPNTKFIVNSRFRPYAVRDGRLVTGQQQYSGTAAVRLVIQALGM